MRACDLPLMLFAAGFGTRMGALTRERPKPMVQLGGRPMIDHAIDLARGAGIARIVANTHYRPEAIEPHLRAKGVAVSREAPAILNTGGGLRHALPLLGTGPVLTMNTDVVLTAPNPFETLSAAWRGGMGALLLVVPLARAHGRLGGGDFAMDAQGRLSRGGDLVYTGAQIIDPAVIAPQDGAVFSLSEVWTRLAGQGRLFGVLHAGQWGDAGHPEGLDACEALLADV